MSLSRAMEFAGLPPLKKHLQRDRLKISFLFIYFYLLKHMEKTFGKIIFLVQHPVHLPGFQIPIIYRLLEARSNEEPSPFKMFGMCAK